MSGVSKFIDKKFDGTNYATWKRQTKDFLIIKGLLKYVVTTEENLQKLKTEGDFEQRAAEAMAYFRATIATNIVREYLQVEAANELWDKIQKHYEEVDMLSIINLNDKLSEIKRKDCKSLNDYITRKTEIFYKLQDANSPLKDVEQVQQILRGLDDKYVAFKTLVNNEINTVSGKDLDTILTKLRNHERGTLNIDDSEEGNGKALFTRQKGEKPRENKGNACACCGKLGMRSPSADTKIKPATIAMRKVT
jgi:hypothetical protein